MFLNNKNSKIQKFVIILFYFVAVSSFLTLLLSVQCLYIHNRFEMFRRRFDIYVLDRLSHSVFLSVRPCPAHTRSLILTIKSNIRYSSSFSYILRDNNINKQKYWRSPNWTANDKQGEWVSATCRNAEIRCGSLTCNLAALSNSVNWLRCEQRLT